MIAAVDPREHARPVVAPPVLEWARDHMRFDTAVDVAPRFVIEKSPYSRVVCDWWLDPSVDEIFLLYPTQAGKTALLITLMAYCTTNDAGPTMFVQADETNVKAFCQKRLKPAMQKTFPALVSGDARDAAWTEDKGARIGLLDLWIAWATSESRLRSWPRRYIFGDETSLWKHPRSLAWERTKQFQKNRKGLWATTPTIETEESWQAATNQFQLHRWWVPCPHCGAFQVLAFEGLRFAHCKEGAVYDFDKVESEAYYECSHCQARIENHHRQQILESGEARTEFPSRSRKRISLRITSLDVPNMSWGHIARKMLESEENDEDKRTFVNGWKVEPYKEVIETTTADKIAARCAGIEKGVAPENTRFVLAGVDVQKHHVWVSVRAFLRNRQSVLLHAARIDGEGSTDRALARCWDEVLSADFKWAGHEDPIQIYKTAVDSGFDISAVYTFCARHNGRVVPFKGIDSSAMTTPWRTSPIDKMYRGKPMPGGMMLYLVNSEMWLAHVLNSYALPIDEPGAWMLYPDVGATYLKHLTSWGQVKKKDKKNREYLEWKRISNENHLLDCEKYTACLADVCGSRWREMGDEKPKPRYGVVGKAF